MTWLRHPDDEQSWIQARVMLTTSSPDIGSWTRCLGLDPQTEADDEQSSFAGLWAAGPGT